jgi:ribonuclease HI
MKKGQLSTLWRALPKFILWKIWLEQNNRIFRETTSNTSQVATRIKAYFGESPPYFYREKISGPLEPKEEQWIKIFKIRDHSQQIGSKGKHETWEIWKEEEDFEEWNRKRNQHILFFDKASKGNPLMEGGGGVLVSPNELLEIAYAWGLGIETNNRAEALELWQGLTQSINQNVQDLVILGDSRLIIQALILRNKTKHVKLQHILEKFQLLLGRLRSYHLFHVLWKLNVLADVEANKGSLLSNGTLQVNGTTTNMEIS